MTILTKILIKVSDDGKKERFGGAFCTSKRKIENSCKNRPKWNEYIIRDMKSVNEPCQWDPTRQSLLSRLKDLGDQQSWRDFFDTYWKLIYSAALQAGLTDAEAQDVVQDTVLSVAKKMPDFTYDPAVGSFKRWLLQ